MKANDAARLRDTAHRLLEQHHVPGLALGVVQGGELVFAEGFGHADIESQRPQDPALRQRIGSITKTMTALCIMALVDEGRLSLDDRAVDLLPDLPFDGPASDVRVRHLLTHTAGIGEAPSLADLPRFDALLFVDQPDATRVPETFPNGLTIEVPPGTKWAYANHGYALLGEIIMRAEGASLPDVMRRRIFEPLGMSNTDCLDEPHPALTTGYHRAPGEDERAMLERAGRSIVDEETVDGHNIRGSYQYLKGMSRRASGAVQSSVPDMARYASALLSGGAGIVRPETFDAMLQPHWQLDERLTAIGLSFFLERQFDRRTFHHNGSVSGGWNTSMTILPDDGLALLVHMNLAYDKFEAVQHELLRALLDAPPPAMPDAAVHSDILASAPGVYEAPLPGPLTNFRIATTHGRLQVLRRDGALWLHARRGVWKQGARMYPAGDGDSFLVPEGDGASPARIVVIRDGNGRVGGLRLDVSCAVEMVRTDQVAPWA